LFVGIATTYNHPKQSTRFSFLERSQDTYAALVLILLLGNALETVENEAFFAISGFWVVDSKKQE
jgi:hypothetical protein